MLLLDRKKRITLYGVLLVCVVIPTSALAFLLELQILETIMLLPAFPLILTIMVGLFFFLLIGAILPTERLSRISLDIASSIPSDRDNPKAFIIGSLMVSFTFFTLFTLLSPEEVLSSLPIFNTRNLGDTIIQLFSQTQAISDSITFFLQFLIFPLLGCLTLAGIQIYRITNYGWNAIAFNKRNDPGAKFLKSLKILFFVSFFLLIFSTALGGSPSGYPLADYYLWLLLIIIPGSIMGAWIAKFPITWTESGFNSNNRKLATLRLAELAEFIEVPEGERDLYKIQETIELGLDGYERYAFNRLLVIFPPPESLKRLDFRVKTCKIVVNELKEVKDDIMEIQKDKQQKPLYSIKYDENEQTAQKMIEEQKEDRRRIEEHLKRMEECTKRIEELGKSPEDQTEK